MSYMDTDTLLKELKKIRAELGITQIDLAHQAHVSLPTIQNIEAARANPAIQTLQSLASQLGLEFKLNVKQTNWDLFAFYGAPLMVQQLPRRDRLSSIEMLQCLRESCLELKYHPEIQDRERKLEATQAFLLALQGHYPTFFKKYCMPSELISKIVPKHISGRLIKLKRIASARLADYL